MIYPPIDLDQLMRFLTDLRYLCMIVAFYQWFIGVWRGWNR